MTTTQKQKFVKANAAQLGVTVSAISAMDESQLDALIAQLDDQESGDTSSSDVANALGSMQLATVTTKSGEQVPVVTAKFISGSQTSCRFETSDGKVIVTNGPRVISLAAAGRIAPDTILGFKPDKMVWNEARGFYYGEVNQSFTPELFEVINNFVEKSNEHFASRVNELIVKYNFTPAEAREKAKEERNSAISKPKPMPTLEL
jgi:rhamnose utilization protein RhaD (predicted bifunctional aldolase and dehydrogenase)